MQLNHCLHIRQKNEAVKHPTSVNENADKTKLQNGEAKRHILKQITSLTHNKGTPSTIDNIFFMSVSMVDGS